MQNINRVVLTANLTRDPELRNTASGVAVCNLRVASNSRTKQNGEWGDKANYFDVVCFGSQAENVVKYLSKGKPIAVDGRLDFREWTTDTGDKRQAVQIIADTIQFLGDGRSGDESGNGGGGQQQAAAVVTPAVDEDIPF